MSGERIGDERRGVRSADRRQPAEHSELHGSVLAALPVTPRRPRARRPLRPHPHGVSVQEGVVARTLGRLLQTASPRPRRRPAVLRLVLAEGLLALENRAQYVLYTVVSMPIGLRILCYLHWYASGMECH